MAIYISRIHNPHTASRPGPAMPRFPSDFRAHSQFSPNYALVDSLIPPIHSQNLNLTTTPNFDQPINVETTAIMADAEYVRIYNLSFCAWWLRSLDWSQVPSHIVSTSLCEQHANSFSLSRTLRQLPRSRRREHSESFPTEELTSTSTPPTHTFLRPRISKGIFLLPSK